MFTGTPRFALGRRLGAGGFGTVYEALDRQLGATVAVKVLERMSPDALYRFKREFRGLARLSHPNLVALYELQAVERRWFFSMELLRGRDFLEHVRGVTSEEGAPLLSTETDGAGEVGGAAGGASPGSFDAERLVDALLQLSEGLCYLHAAGTLHRDIKPSNVLCTTEGRAVILDFGLAIEVAEEDGTTAGTPAYMSPEQAAGRPLGPASDWYSVGVMLYQALTGRLPFMGTAAQIRRDKQLHAPLYLPAELAGAPPVLWALAVDLLAREPDARPDGAAVLARLRPSRPGRTTAAIGPPATPALLGRETHLAAFMDAYTASRTGRAVVVLCHGGSGAGKSSLCRHFLRELHAREADMVALTGQCYEREEVPFKALDGVIDALGQLLRRLPAEEVAALLPEGIGALCQVFPVLSLAPSVERRAVADAQQARRAALRGLRELLQRLAERRPLVCFIDDLQWGDLDSVSALTELLRPPQPPALLLVCSYRTEEATTSRALGELLAMLRAAVMVREVAVDDLGPVEAERLAAVLGGEARAGAIAAEARGNPFFITELCRHRGALTASTVDELIVARVAELPVASRQLLTLTCVAGQPLARSCAARAAFGAGPDDPKALGLLRSGQLIRVRQSGAAEDVLPYHDRVREAVVARLSPAERRTAHRALAYALEGHGEADPEQLMGHFEQAGETGKAARHAVAAATRAHEALAFERAARLCRTALGYAALPAAEVPVLQARLGDALAGTGRTRAAAEAFLAAAVEDAGRAMELRTRAAHQLLFAGHVEAGKQALQPVLRQVGLRLGASAVVAVCTLLWLRLRILARGSGFVARAPGVVPRETVLRIEVCRIVGISLLTNDPLHGLVFQARHLLLALRAGDAHQVVHALASEACVGAYVPGMWSRSERCLRDARALVEQYPDLYAHGFVEYSAANLAAADGRWGDAADHARASKRLIERATTALGIEIDSVDAFLILALRHCGALKELAATVAAVLPDLTARDDNGQQAMVRMVGDCPAQLAADRPERARETLSLAAPNVPQKSVLLRFGAVTAAATVELYAGRPGEARRLLGAARRELERMGISRMPVIRVEWRYLEATAALACARESPAPQLLWAEATRTVRRIAGERASWPRPFADALAAAAAHQQGRDAEAVRRIASAEDGFQATGLRLHAAGARRRRGEWLGGDVGASLCAEADAWMRSEAIVNPGRMADTVIPAGR